MCSSDLSIEELIAKAEDKKLGVLVLTDHDRVVMEYGLFPFRHLIKKREEVDRMAISGGESTLNRSWLIQFVKILRKLNPDKEARLKIFEIHTKTMPLDTELDLKLLADRARDYTGADIEALCREAAMLVIREALKEKGDIKNKTVTLEHFNKALDKIRPSVNAEMIKNYKALLAKFESGEAEELRYMT